VAAAVEAEVAVVVVEEAEVVEAAAAERVMTHRSRPGAQSPQPPTAAPPTILAA
jgi:hypothetical protein